jgi:hypothetical protein
MGKAYKFVLNPEEYKQSEPSRVTVTQTKTGAWVDDFGAGIQTIMFNGTTGFRSPEMRAYLNNGTETNNNQQRYLEDILRNDSGQYTPGSRRWAINQLESTLTGFLKFKELRDLVRKYYNKMPSGRTLTADKELIFHNYTDEEHWVVVPVTFELMRSVSRPLLYQYNIQLLCIRSADTPQEVLRESDTLAVALPKFDLRTMPKGVV